MRTLILGGTQFLGRHFVAAVQERGWELTLFNRGQTNPDVYPELEQLRGNRDPKVEPGLAALEGRSWDIVVDPSGYVPRLVNASLGALASSGYYCFISSISVYSDFATPGQDESAPLGEIDDPTTEEWAGAAYGPLKVLCENEVIAARPESHLNVRAGLIIGPHDPTERYTYWVRRVARGGEVLAPVGPEFPVQAIHARDIAEWSLEMAATGRSGTYNVTSGVYPLGELLETARHVTGSDARFTYVSDEFLQEQEAAALVAAGDGRLDADERGRRPAAGPERTPAGANDPGDLRLDPRNTAGRPERRPDAGTRSGAAGGLGRALGVSLRRRVLWLYRAEVWQAMCSTFADTFVICKVTNWENMMTLGFR